MENKPVLLKTYSAGELNVLRPLIQQNSFAPASFSPSSSPLFGAKQTTRCSSANEIIPRKPPAAGTHDPRYHRSRCRRKSICSSGSGASLSRIGSDSSASSPPSTAYSPTWPMQIHSTGSESPLRFPAPKTVLHGVAAEESLVNHQATDLGYCRLDEAPCQEGPRIGVPSFRVGGSPPHSDCIAKPTSLAPISATRRREYAAQFRDLFHPKQEYHHNHHHHHHQKQHRNDSSETARPLVSWEDASRLFQTQFGISSSVALTIWKQVDSDGDLKLDESEYCLAASLAEKVASTGFTLLEVNGLAHALENEANRPFETSSLLDDSRDLLLSPASASLLTPDVSEDSDLVGRGGVDAQQPAMILSEQPYDTDNASLLSDFSFSRLAERSTLAYGAPLFTGEPTGLHSSAVTLPSHSSPDLGGLSGLAVGHREIWASSDVAARPPEAELTPSKDENTGELTFVTGPHTMGIIEDQRGDEQEVEEEEDEEEEVASSENEENEAGVAALLPTPGSQRGIVAKVNENLLIRSSGGGGDDDDASNSAVSSHASFSSVAAAASSSSSTTSSTSASSSSSSSSPSSSSLSRHARFLDYDHPSPSDNSCDSHHVRSEDVDPITLLAGIADRDAGCLRTLPKCRRRRILARMEGLSKFINHTLLRLNNELAGELQELFDQQVNLNVQVHHLSLLHQQHQQQQQQSSVPHESTELSASPPLSPVFPRKFS